MIYDIRHVTTYSYERPVRFARCTLRLIPSTAAGQQLLSTDLDVTPAPASRTDRMSFFGHNVIALTIETPHRELEVKARSRVAVEREVLPADTATRAWEQVRDDVPELQSLAASSPVHHVYASPLAPICEPITRYVHESFPPGRKLLEAAVELMHRVRSDFKYDKKATVVSTPLHRVFEMRRGVCQDFTHVMIAGLRGIGIPAAYVSGYIRTVAPPGAKRLEGADATHAWVSVWCGEEIGWVGLDPTNGILVGNDHIVLATGRDYTDISPVDGVILGSGPQKLRIQVDVVPVEERSLAAAAERESRP